MKYKVGLKEYRDLFEQAPIALYVIDPDGYFILANRRFCESTGYSSNELLQMHILDTYLESEIDLFSTYLEHSKIKKEMLMERSIVRKNRTTFYAQINIRVLDNGWLKGIVHEVPVQKDITMKLAENEEKFRQITEHIRDVFFLVDLNTGKFLYVSSGYETIWGKSIRSLLIEPTSWMEMIHPEDKETVLRLYHQQQKTGFLEANYRIIRPDKTIRWVHARTFPVYNNKQQLYRSAGVAEDITEHMLIKQELLEYSKNLQRNFHEIIIAMSTAMEHRDAYTAGHQSKVAYLSIEIAKELKLSKSQLECIEIAAQIHDIGKIGIPIEILTKPNKLSNLEYELVKTHAQAGYDILKGIHFPWPIAEIVLEHHERLNGSGYPKGLKGNEIRLETKILAVADTIDAMASFRPYRAALGLTSAIAEIHKSRGILFDPNVVDACEKIFREKKINLY
ncbi:MAG: PAS domain S-box protein [Legionella longbeachae]|nr:PAS domain S-box protein [Legionella longbeachae]